MVAFLAPLLGLAGGAVSAIGAGVSGDQKDALEMARQAALGRGPSVAREMLNRGAVEGRRAAMAAAASGPRSGAALSARNAAMAGARSVGDAAMNAALVGAGEQQQARQQFAAQSAQHQAIKQRQMGSIGAGLSSLGGGLIGSMAPLGGGPGGAPAVPTTTTADAGGMGAALSARPGVGTAPAGAPGGAGSEAAAAAQMLSSGAYRPTGQAANTMAGSMGALRSPAPASPAPAGPVAQPSNPLAGTSSQLELFRRWMMLGGR